jgi:hypothetical protein
MTLFVQSDTGGTGAGTVYPLRAEADLLQICQMDTNTGETQLTTPADLLQVTYGTQVATGPCPTRIHLLVNTNFGVNAANIDIIILALDSSFVLTDGTLLSSFGGLTLPVGNSENPTTSVLVLYDTSQAGGSGYCAKGLVSGNYDLQTPNPVILYHELSHAFRDATSTSLSLSASGCTASPEEAAAETDENDMRTQLAIPLRDTTDHCGQNCSGGAGPNTGSCCIIASIATGSPYSGDVNQLRLLRDSFLRASETGHTLFDHFFYDYYDFSPQLCTMMAKSGTLRSSAELYMVRPLTLCLELIRHYTLDQFTPEDLGAFFQESLRTSPELQNLTADNLEQALKLLADVRRGVRVPELASVGVDPELTDRICSSPYVGWMIVDPLDMYASALLGRAQGQTPAEIGQQLASRIDKWAADMPITESWSILSEYELDKELRFLSTTTLRHEEFRSVFARRLIDQLDPERDLRGVLARSGFVLEGGFHEQRNRN